MKHYNSYRSYLKERFSSPVLKIPINGGFSCPNRDGLKSNTGCFFCDNQSFSPVAHETVSPLDQLDHAVKNAGPKFKAFLPYLQPYSNTYGDIEYLKSIYEPLIGYPGVIGLAIGTRPDCFNTNTYSYLEEIASKTYLSIEIGLQSTHNSTLKLINRGHTYEEFSQAVKELSSRGIETVAHMMIGLPKETSAMIVESAKKISKLPVSGVKIHQLMIIRGTTFELWYNDKQIQPLNLNTYTEILCEFLKYLNPDQHIHRLIADSRQQYGLIEPLWSAEKLKSLTVINAYMSKNKIVQGSQYE